MSLIGFLKESDNPKAERVRKLLYAGMALLAALTALVMTLVPFCSASVDGERHDMLVLNALALFEEDAMIRNGMAFVGVGVPVIWLLFVIPGAIFLVRAIVGFFNEEEVLIRSTKLVLIFLSALTAVYFVGGILVSAISSLTAGPALPAYGNILALVFALGLDVVFAVLTGSLHTQTEGDTDEERQELSRQNKIIYKARLELWLYSVFMSAVTVAALLGNILTVKTNSASLGTSSTFSITGWKLFTQYATLDGGGQLVVFFLFAILCLVLTLAFLSFLAYVSKSKTFYRLALSSIVLSAVGCLLVGLFGKYYQIVQELNKGMILAWIAELSGGLLNIDVTYKVSSGSIYFFVLSVIGLGVLLLRRPYSKALAIENELEKADFSVNAQKVKAEVAVTELPKSEANAQPSSEAVPEQKTPLSEDPCPAFTDVDRKVKNFQLELAEKRKSLFAEPTLPKLVQFVVNYARDSRLHLSYTAEDIAAFIAGLGTTRLTILQGMSGTGKTSLPKIFTEALFSKCDIIEVESSWRDKNELLGYYNEFSKTYTPKKFTQALYQAKLNPETLTFIVLDEMNLSRIEYYFSDFLSLMENEPDKRELKLLNVGLYRTVDGKRFAYRGLTEGHTLKIPANVWFIGTANRDESTFEISDKVYDRAHTMNFNKRAAKVLLYNEPLAPQYLPADELLKLFDEAKRTVNFNIDAYPVIGEVEKLLAPYNISFGNRIAMQIESFVSIYCSCFSATDAVIHTAVETILLSKVVSKLELKSVPNKEELAAEFDKLNLHKCSEFILKLNED